MGLLALVSALAEASDKVVIVASGDCSDPALIRGTQNMREAAGRLLGPTLMSPEEVLDIVRPRASRSLQAIERQTDSGRAQFYGGQPAQAEALIDRALEELERVSPEAKPWPATVNALVLKALITKNLNRPKEMAEVFRRIVRIEPSFKLDPDAHAPSAIAALEQIKKEVSRARKTTFHVRVESGPAATVFIDGQSMGQTPLKVDLIPGLYRVTLLTDSKTSFPKIIEVGRESKLSVDMEFEASVSAQPPLCVAAPEDHAAVKLAQLVLATKVIVVRNVAKRGDPAYLTGSLFNLSTGQQERAGSVQPDLFANLVTFLVTGKEMSGVRSGASEASPPLHVQEAPAPSALPPATLAQPRPSSPPVPLIPSPPEAVSGGRVASIVLVVAGGAAALGGVVAFVLQNDRRTRLAELTPEFVLPEVSQPQERAEALSAIAALDANRITSFTLIGAGAGAVVAGVVGLQLFPAPAAQPVRVSLLPALNGVSVAGRF